MSDLDEIRSAVTSITNAINAKDAAGAAGHYDNDGSVLPPGAPQMVGREAIQNYWQTAADMGLTDVVITSVDIEIFGDQAIERGVLSGKLGDQALAGKYIVWWKKSGDGWKLYHDIWNFDA